MEAMILIPTHILPPVIVLHMHTQTYQIPVPPNCLTQVPVPPNCLAQVPVPPNILQHSPSIINSVPLVHCNSEALTSESLVAMATGSSGKGLPDDEEPP